jgi:hypothetical protein
LAFDIIGIGAEKPTNPQGARGVAADGLAYDAVGMNDPAAPAQKINYRPTTHCGVGFATPYEEADGNTPARVIAPRIAIAIQSAIRLRTADSEDVILMTTCSGS